ncbi:metal ABC transporter solute-binding protein, Zn/Mn family [Neobacillus terrae]|uniref:metal ABC transporter solute-binding protein, Zn/Mn family n=1 Tax=Neobacillus terrae TaxID=3034837 RepID=UPI0014096506|nr:zinc ABC transporter substrate-binding protein [Neobacillus terrae]NHM33144.1 zinc ABC transporter solute-binding protein [Neobacillus terrae]
MKNLSFTFSLVLAFGLILSGCSGSNSSSEKKKNVLSIYTTVFPLQYFSERIGGKYVKVSTIYPPGADEHTFEPSQKDMMNLADSDLFEYIGLGLEGFVGKAKETLKNENVTMLAAAKNLKLPKNPENTDDGDGHSDVNPHVWLDPIYSKEMAAVIRDAMIKKMPGQKEYFNQNYNKLAGELDQLNKDFKQTADNAVHKEFIVTHAAFGYWETRYGIKQISIAGLSTANEPSQKKLEGIVSAVEKEHLKYILFEQNVNSKLGEIVGNETGVKALPIHNLAILTNKNIKDKETYFTLMKKNLETLKIALNN